MELDKALEYAVILAWEDLTKGSEPWAVRVEYQCTPGASLDSLLIWADKGGGYRHLICNYSIWSSPAHPSGVVFTEGSYSDGLGKNLDFIMKNQHRFTCRAVDASRQCFILIHPPTTDERAEAATWRAESYGGAQNSGEAAVDRIPVSALPLTDPRPEKLVAAMPQAWHSGA